MLYKIMYFCFKKVYVVCLLWKYVSLLVLNIVNSLNLALYRHWTVEASLRYSMYTAVRLKLWTIRGEKRLQQLMAEMG